MIDTRKRITFQYMGAYWSLSYRRFGEMMDFLNKHGSIDMYEFGARELRRKPARLDYLRITER